MHEEEPTVDERIDFLRRVKNANDKDLEDVLNRPERWNLAPWQMEIIKDQQQRRAQAKLRHTMERLAANISRHELDEDEQERLKEQVRNNLREKWFNTSIEREGNHRL